MREFHVIRDSRGMTTTIDDRDQIRLGIVRHAEDLREAITQRFRQLQEECPWGRCDE
jgi:hypothetical protein